jgi:8-oxo-dGTP pyrophosphatase MutT (NUDIX family)
MARDVIWISWLQRSDTASVPVQPTSTMAAPRYPTQQYLAGDFVISSGCVLFRNNPSSKALEICILHHLRRDEWLLPKGRKDRGETIEQAALRETYEETGFKCSLWPQRMPTRAPAPGVDNVFTTQIVENLVEPIGITIRNLSKGDIKIIFWFIAQAEVGVDKVHGTQMATEAFDSIFVDAQEAAGRLTFESDREIVRRALALVAT